MGLPVTASADETRQLIEGKLQEARDAANVQVVVDEVAAVTVKLSLMDDEGVFHEAPPLTKPAKEEGLLQKLTDTEQ